MILTLATHHSRKISFFIVYSFFISGLCSFVYGRDYKEVNHFYGSYDGYSNNRNANRKNNITHDGRNKTKNESPFKKNKKKEQNKFGKGDIGGPSQPEMSAFKPVGADNMVDPFTGDFSYNIPLLDVGGYPVNIFYNSGVTMDQEASWVGLGWNINPGTISRNMRGIPDDFDGSEEIKKWVYTKPDKTYGVNVGGRLEFFGGTFNLDLSAGVFYSNMRGLGLEAGVNPAISLASKAGDDKTASISLGWKLNGNSQTGGSSTFSIALKQKWSSSMSGSLTGSIGIHSRQGLQALHLDAELSMMSKQDKTQSSIANGNMEFNPTIGTSINFAYPSYTPSARTRFSSENYDLDLGYGGAGMGAFAHVRLGGYYTQRWIKNEDVLSKQPAYGMIYFAKGQQDKNALLDFNRLNDGVYTPGTPAISIPVYTYDVFSISGEGTGGSFRAYRGDVGYVQDSYLQNTGSSDHLGIELGGGSYGHGAINANIVLTPSSSGGWDKGNFVKSVIPFKPSYRDYQGVYFKNPGEKTIPDINYQNAIGGEDLVRLKMTNVGVGSPTLIPTFVRYTDMLQKQPDLMINPNAIQKSRDKRTQVISFLTAYEADRVGLNKQISYVRLNEVDSNQVVFGCSNTNRSTMKRFDGVTRKQNHISEIDVLMQDGKRYIYDIPVYNLKQINVTFNKTGSAAGNGTNNSITDFVAGTDDIAGNNNNGKEGYVEREEIPPYAHSYLLTALLSPNYVDVKGDGITDDDMGDAIKFNYSKSDDILKWRTPAGNNKASLSEGLKTDKDDDKAHYIYGEKELWYLYSIESKNMVARFYVRNDRKDAKAIKEDGNIETNLGAYRLSKISVFTKGELLKNPTNPKPVKTVHFEYDYSLCENAPGSVSGYGKLTLKSIYFTYNGNNRAKKNYYRFSYPSTSNPSYSFTANDRWGNYKADPTTGLTNADFPYTDQDGTKTNGYIKAWTLNKITLPSGADINIDYEADDYAYVQNRRASNMMSVAGFGNSTSPTSYSNKLYENKNSIYDYIYINVSRAITATTTSTIKSQIQQWYLGNWDKSKQVLMKLAVNMPSDKRGTGFELIPVYAEILDYGVIPNTSGQKIYIKVKRLASGYSPMMHYSLQFLKSNLPSKAYPGYDVSEEGGLRAIVKALGGLYHSFKEIFNGGMGLMVDEKKCISTDLSKSFIRLTNPYLKKLGGGLRVKKIVIDDNFQKMTRSNPNANDGMINATYGQEYFYTKHETVNGENMTISSGVAGWEPAIGAEENPHRQALEFYNKNPRGDYDFRTMETPFAEMLYPSPSVGYSRVEIRSIHRDTVKNAPGISVQEFYTTREFPTVSSYTPLSEYNAEDRFESGALDKLLKINIKSAVALSQGFKVDLNDMNGKLRKQSNYSPNNLNDPISYTENFYSIIKTSANSYKLNHSFPVIGSADGQIQQSIIGREIEIMTDFREHNQQTITTNVNFNVDVINGVFIPIPVPTTWKPVVKESNIYRSSSILKVVNHYGVLDSVVAVDKGSMVSTKNLVFDAETGDPLLNRTNNEHNKPVYTFSYPAHWAYSGMGLAYKNIDVIYTDVSFRNGKLETSGVDFNLFESGDEIMVDETLPVLGTQPCDPLILAKNPAKKIWAVYTGKSGSQTPQWVFMDANGNPYTAKVGMMRIIRSGKRNMYSAAVGSIVSLKNPVNSTTGQLQFVDATNIIQTSAATYKDHWRVDESLYRKDSVVTTYVNARVRKTNFFPSNNETAFMYHHLTDDPVYSSSSGNSLLVSMKHQKHRSGSHGKKWINRSFLQFDFSSNPLPGGAKLYKAFLSLYSHIGPNAQSNQNAIHPGVHNNLNPQSIGIQQMIRYMKGSWYSSNASGSWGNDYVYTDNNLSSTTSILPPSVTQTENYIQGNNGWVDITRIVSDNSTSTLGLANKIGIAFNLPGDNGYPDQDIDKYRCFWAYGNGKIGASPRLTYYYYVCGDTASYYSEDPFENKLVSCYSYDTTVSYCYSKFTQRKSVNPYVEGIWGNWRVDTSFVYYGDRKENVIDNNPVDLRTAGTIINYKNFWNFSTSILSPFLARNYSASDVWVWNSSITQYNRKGYEIENKDPLERFNAGLYGYGQQLPIAVINNSRHMESMYDGFEDYDYQSNSCTEFCQPRRHVNMGAIQSFLDASQKHSGKQSIKLNAGQTFSFSAPVVSTASLDKAYSMRVKMDSVSYNDTVISSNGNGLTAIYYNHSGHVLHTSIILCPGQQNGVQAYTAIEYPVILTPRNMADISPRPGVNKDYYSVRWSGKLVPRQSGSYIFRASTDNGCRIKINGNYITNNNQTFGAAGCGGTGGNIINSPLTSNSVYLLKGQSYDIEIDMFEQWGAAYFDGFTWSINNSGFTQVPIQCLYSNTYGTVSVQYTQTWCTKLDSVNVRGNALTDSFSLIQGKKMLVSAWVKVGGNDCKCSTYVNNKIRVSYTGSSEIKEFTPAGSIIEGWQRYEGIFDVPSTATQIQVELMNTGTNSAAWFDDVRIHPFNANMKSFVYHPQNLRLTAELDENNYASFYEYDDEGTLTRVKKETIKGIKTITETRSHLQKSIQ